MRSVIATFGEACWIKAHAQTLFPDLHTHINQIHVDVMNYRIKTINYEAELLPSHPPHSFILNCQLSINRCTPVMSSL